MGKLLLNKFLTAIIAVRKNVGLRKIYRMVIMAQQFLDE